MRRRGLIGLVCIVFLSVACFAQRPQRPCPQATESRISIVRLRVPAKVRKLYGEAAEAFRKHSYVEAQRKLDQALQKHPEFPEALTLKGFIERDLNRWELAERSLQAAIRSDPSYAVAHRLLADLYNRQQRFDDALASSQRAVELNPASWPEQYELARALIGKHQYALAVKISDASLRTDRGTLLHVAKAHALLGLGRYPEASEELRTYLQYEPAGDGSQDARDLLNQIRTAMGQ